MTKTFLQLVYQAQQICLQKQVAEQNVFSIIYHLSSKINNLADYVAFMHEPIDFCEQSFTTIFNRLVNDQIPLARLLEKTDFYGASLIVHSNVFIPRHETELVVDAVLYSDQINHAKNLVDFCAGTGAIGLTIKKLIPQLNCTLVELSHSAIVNCQTNATAWNLDVQVIASDWKAHFINHEYEIITANFPYLGFDDPVEFGLLENEPHLALYANDQGWAHYQTLLDLLKIKQQWSLVVLETSAFHYDKWIIVIKNHPEWNFDMIKDHNNYLRVIKISR